MKTYPSASIRNVALVGHGGSGKTSLAEALLFRAEAIPRLGRVEDGTTTCDFDPEEQERMQSLGLALAPFEWAGHKVNVLDTPGYADFVGHVHAALRVADLAVFVVSAVEGVEVQTEAAWRIAADLGLPRMIFINKLDKERADFNRTLDELQEKFGTGVAPLELPIGHEASFHGIADLLTDRAYLYDAGHGEEADIPDEMEELEHRIHDSLVENIVVADDELTERYLEGGTIGVHELEKTLARGVLTGQVFPVVCGSATGPIAVDRLANFICEIGPSPTDRSPAVVRAGDTDVEVPCDPAGEPLAFVFATVADPYVGKVSLFRVLSGSIKPDQHLTNVRTGTDERLHGLFTMRGKEQVDIGEVPAGDIAAVAKLDDVLGSDTLAPKSQPVVVPPIDYPEPVHHVAIVARTQGDEEKLPTALHRLAGDDPALTIERNDETHQTIIGGLGEIHVQIALGRMERKFGVAVDVRDIQVPYRETIQAESEAEGKYKKQSGGHGQFGVCSLRLEPLDRGQGFEFVDAIVGGVIPRQFIPAVEKGVLETMARGGVIGYPVVDVRVTVYDGKHHPVDSSEMSFKSAARLAFRAAMANGTPVVLEPVNQVTVTIPPEHQGDVMGDLNGRRGRIDGTDVDQFGNQVVTAQIPASEMLRYSIDLRSMTSGRGSFTARFDHYDVMPNHLVEAIRRDVAGDDD